MFLSKIIFILNFVNIFIEFIIANIENININYSPPRQTYDELYNDGLTAYSKDDHQNAVYYFEKAISDYRHELDVKAECWITCQEKFKYNLLSYKTNLFDGQLENLHYFVKMKACTEQCQKKFLGARGPVARYMKELFERREPYNYIQYSYYKTGEVNKSINAAYTYYEMHPDDHQMKQNLDILLNMVGRPFISASSMEELPHISLYKRGEISYEENQYHMCITHFEESLTLFYKELQKCHALCEYQHEKHQASYSASLFAHFKAILDCRQQCQTSLTKINSKTSTTHFVPYYFHYLQICYFQIGRVYDAAVSAETYSMMLPTDPVMLANLAYYKKHENVRGKEIKPRERAKKYFQEYTLEFSLYKIVKGYSEPLFANNTESDIQEEEIDSIYQSVAEELSASRMVKGDLDESDPIAASVPLQYRNQKRWKDHVDTQNVSLLLEEAALNGTDRVAFDGLATEEQCSTLMNLVQVLSKEYHRKIMETRINQVKDMQLAIRGDGYQHNHKDAAHPFTKKEEFKGVSVITAVDALAAGKASLNDVELYFNLSERARLLTQEYFDLPVRLNFAFTHLVCRHALEDEIKADEEHISHPVHSDNCVLDADGEGTCAKRAPAYTWRDYSGLLYLNDDFEGGEFIFADYKRHIQARVRPKCGRFVAFRSNGVENLHGVLGVRKGIRCALPMWFTLSSNISEDGRPGSESKLKILKQKILAGTLKRKVKSEL